MEAFAAIKARVKVERLPQLRGLRELELDVVRDRRGELFLIRVQSGIDPMSRIVVRNIDKPRRHLLLDILNDDQDQRVVHNLLLCGHDERHHFVAGISDRGAGTVRSALESLKPALVREAELAAGVRRQNRFTRKNEAFVRQGEWFFIPARVEVPRGSALRHEPLQAIGRKPHMAEFAFRTEGEVIYTHRTQGQVREADYGKFLKEHPSHRQGWTMRRLNPKVFVRGTIKHPDHKTLRLDSWHQVLLSNETSAMGFID